MADGEIRDEKGRRYNHIQVCDFIANSDYGLWAIGGDHTHSQPSSCLCDLSHMVISRGSTVRLSFRRTNITISATEFVGRPRPNKETRERISAVLMVACSSCKSSSGLHETQRLFYFLAAPVVLCLLYHVGRSSCV